MGKVIMSGIVPQLVAPVTGILAADLAVGSTVKLMENGTAVDYLVVNQGKPSGSSLYDDSCDGLWLLRKDIYENRTFHTGATNAYYGSSLHTYLNGTFLSLFGTIEQAAIKQVKIPYYKSGVVSGANGLSAKVFLLSCIELGYARGSSAYPQSEGAEVSYFSGIQYVDEKRLATLNGVVAKWWTRSPNTGTRGYCLYVDDDGGLGSINIGSDPNAYQYGVRPAIVLPKNAQFDEETLLFKGVS